MTNQINVVVLQKLISADLRIYDGKGLLVKQIILNDAQSSIDISDLYSGFYFLVVQNYINTYTQKLIKF